MARALLLSSSHAMVGIHSAAFRAPTVSPSSLIPERLKMPKCRGAVASHAPPPPPPKLDLTSVTTALLSDDSSSSPSISRRAALTASIIWMGSFRMLSDGEAAHAAEGYNDYMQIAGTTVEGERFDPEEFSFKVPGTWRYNKKAVKRGKLLLFTDTYGPNYLYSESWPTFKDENDNAAVMKVEVMLTSSGGRSSISELGPPENVDASRAFGLSGLDLADVTSTSVRMDYQGQEYYEWDLATDEGKALVAATISGGAIYALCVYSTEDQAEENAQAIGSLRSSFAVVSSGAFAFDMNTKLNRRRQQGKASADVQEI
eukprot:TRINITY_DN17586_c0_g1_i1.p1 TRINITY_DN17586_c0_g1~~TRINITY_DN17586_c0_g1_i1.p1  ORF type:complete len:315 (+),score=76.57 TRINITY_DN17586_c0_g1_i1:48-992(+)